MWNALLAGVIFQHSSAAELIRELRRNRELLERCGFDPVLGADAAPTQAAFGRFLRLVVKHREWVMKMFEMVVKELSRHLPDLGETVALDSKALRSFGRKVANPEKSDLPDGRRDLDGEIGIKKYKGRRKDGSLWEKVISWFGYKVHLLTDSKYQIPLFFTVTKANVSDVKEGQRVVEKYAEQQPDIARRTRELTADKAYGSREFHTKLYDEYGIKPVIDISTAWKKESTRCLDPDKADSIIYDEKGRLSCVCPWSGDVREMAFMGFEKDRKTLKYRCPAAAYDLDCAGRRICEKGKAVGPFGRIVRVPLASKQAIGGDGDLVGAWVSRRSRDAGGRVGAAPPRGTPVAERRTRPDVKNPYIEDSSTPKVDLPFVGHAPLIYAPGSSSERDAVLETRGRCHGISEKSRISCLPPVSFGNQGGNNKHRHACNMPPSPRLTGFKRLLTTVERRL